MGKKKKRLHKLVCTYRIYFIREERRAEGREPGMRALFRQGRAQPIAIYGARFFFILSSSRFLIKRRDGGISNASHLLGCIALLLLGVLCTQRCLSAPFRGSGIDRIYPHTSCQHSTDTALYWWCGMSTWIWHVRR